jgi:hypothetical protein
MHESINSIASNPIEKYLDLTKKAWAVGASALSLAGGMLSSAETASAREETAVASKNRYYNKTDEFGTTVDSYYIQACERMNVSQTKTDGLFPYSFPYGSIESQYAKTHVGSKTLTVVTKLRDVNFDNTSPVYNRLATEFRYGCTYVTSSNTSLTPINRNGKKELAAPKNVAFQEKPDFYSTNQFRSRVFKTKFLLPKTLGVKDLNKGKYCLRVTQTSRPNVLAWDPSKLRQNPPEYVSQYDPSSYYSNQLIAKNYTIGMISRGQTIPQAVQKSWEKCIYTTKQIMFRHSKNSPWTR